MIDIGRVVRTTSLLVFSAQICTASSPTDPPEIPVVTANDNRAPAGKLKDGQLTLQLELRRARW